MKAAFTRAYNKESHLTPYSLQVVKKSRKGAVDPELIGELDGESQLQEEEEDNGVTADAMIKVDITISHFDWPCFTDMYNNNISFARTSYPKM